MRILWVALFVVLGCGVAAAQDEAPVKPVGPVRISGGVMTGNIKTMVPPVYPADAKRQHVEGSVVLHVIVGKNGEVKKLDVISGSPLLSDAAIDAVKRWTYKPYLLNGEPVEVETTITVNFSFGSGPNAIKAGITAGHLVSAPAPTYPAKAKAAGIEGAVVLHGMIEKDGTLDHLTVVSGREELRQAALDAASRWRYTPYLLNGVATSVDTTVTVNFKMGSGPQGLPTESLGVLPPPPPPPAAPAAWERTQGVLRLSSGTMAAQLISKVDPEFPEESEPGTVELGITVGTDGAVEKALILAGPAELRDLSIAAVKQWKYKPYTVDGAAVEVETRVTLKFGDGGETPPPPRLDADIVSLPEHDPGLKVVTKVQPRYPIEAKQNRISGAVRMSVVIGMDGSVESVEVLSGPELLRDSAMEAVRQWRYTPYVVGGVAKRARTVVTVNYSFR
jgi:TonB family protein